jgi:prevent-host-death family protein
MSLEEFEELRRTPTESASRPATSSRPRSSTTIAVRPIPRSGAGAPRLVVLDRSRGAAVEAGTPVTLTVHGRPMADIIPHAERQERRPSELLYKEFEQLAGLAQQLGVQGRERLSDYDTGWSSDDLA